MNAQVAVASEPAQLNAVSAPSEFKTLRLDAKGLVEDGATLDGGPVNELDLLARAALLTTEEWKLVTVDNSVWIFSRPLRPHRGLALRIREPGSKAAGKPPARRRAPRRGDDHAR
jgi:hypothetical protein